VKEEGWLSEGCMVKVADEGEGWLVRGGT